MLKNSFIQLGKDEGKEEGQESEKIRLTMNMLKENASLEFISKVTGLSIEKINSLKENL